MPLHWNQIDRSLLLILLAPILLNAQPFRREIASIPVSMFGSQVAQPFAGGVNAPNHQFVDIDGDGDLDLFVLDNDFGVDFYRNVGARTVPAFELQPDAVQLPSFQTFFLFIDLNADRLIDLVTDDFSSGARYFQNTGARENPNFTLNANPILDADGHPLFAGFSSIPAFGDFNGDGLPDFISTNTADGSINYYENRGTVSQPSFQFMTGSFQGITIIGDTCLTRISAGGVQKIQHGSGAYFAAVLDSNETINIFYGDFYSSGLFFLRNSGSVTSPVIECGSNRYPPNQPVSTAGFNQPTLVDIDGDGDLDLFIGVLNDMPRHSFWYYENLGNPAAPRFQLRSKDYLSVIDVGKNASPTLVDIDGDGKLDIVAGTLNGQLWYFHNTGTISDPSFALADTLFGGITGNFSYAPAFADLDGKGLNDAIVGQFNGVVKFYQNIGTPAIPLYDLDPGHVDSLKVGKFDATPTLIDIDGDGDLDLFVGKSDGTISFYSNEGSATAPIWELVSEFFQNIYVVEGAKPIFRDINNDGDADLFLGNADGDILLYENYGTPQSPVYRCRIHHFITASRIKNAAPTLGDLDGDGDFDVVVGTSKGGFQFYRNTHASGLFVTHSVQLVSPPDGAVSQPISITLRWTTSGCAISYALQVARDTDFTRLVLEDRSLTDTASIVGGLEYGTQYFWRVQTRFEGDHVVLSGSRSFTTIPTIPPIPLLISPTNQAIRQPVTLRLRWTSSAGAEQYHLQLSTRPDFNHILIDDSAVVNTSFVVGPLALATKYYWRVQAQNAAGLSAFSDVWEYTTTKVAPNFLDQNYPNPVRGETRIVFSIAVDEHVKISLYNVLGENVATLVDQSMSAGDHAITWHALDFPGGVYYYRLVTHDFTALKKLILAK